MNNNTNNNRESQSQSWWGWGLGAAAVIGGAAYLLSGSFKKKEEERRTVNQDNDSESSNTSYLSDMVSRITLDRRFNGTSCSRESTAQNSRSLSSPVITNLNSLLSDIYVRFLQLKEFDIHYKVFDTVFNDLHNKMKQVDAYYRRYSSTVEFAGSHRDKLRIKKPDEFDMDVVIRLPLNSRTDPLNPAESDIVLEPKFAGFVQLKMGIQFQRLHMRDGEQWLINRAAYEWKDNSNYLLRSKFTQWFDSVVTRALDSYEVRNSGRPVVYVEGIPYVINVSRAGPAKTLFIRGLSNNFKMDVDLVPALRFPEDRWPICRPYRAIPPKCRKGYWMVVPKPNKDTQIPQDEMRSWRIALHDQEGQLMYKCHNLKTTIKLMKALRDALGMRKIASYYIKTLFFWEIIEKDDENYWRNSLAILFERMVAKFHQALVEGKIPYFWNKNNNLIGNVPENTLKQYAKKLESLMLILEDPSKYKLVAKYLLTPNEFYEYNANFLHI